MRELVFADSRLLSPGPDRKPRTLHSVSKSPHFLSSLFVPLVEGEKPWTSNEVRSGLTVADHISRQPLSRWRVLGEETLDGEQAILAEIAQQEAVAVPLKRHKGELSLTQGYLAWFSKSHGLMPVRIEQTMRYGFGGKEYRLECRPDGKALLVYVAGDFVRFRDMWVPRVGSQTLYLAKEYSPTKPAAFDPDDLVDKLVAAGAGRFPGEREIGYRKEWKVLELGPIDPSLNLWFEPEPGRKCSTRRRSSDIRFRSRQAARARDEGRGLRKNAPAASPRYDASPLSNAFMCRWASHNDIVSAKP